MNAANHPSEFALNPGSGMLDSAYLRAILRREAVDTGLHAPVRRAQALLLPLLSRWAGASLVKVEPSGSFAKGTANRSGTDIDLFISLSEHTDATLQAIHHGLHRALSAAGYQVRLKNVALGIRAAGCSVDLVPAKRQNRLTFDHSIYLHRRDTWIKTNILKQVDWVHSTGRQDEMRLMKLWRDQHNLDWPSFYVELATARALAELILPETLDGSLRRILAFVRDRLQYASFPDPGNPSNIVSDMLTAEEKRAIARAAANSLQQADIRKILR